MYDPRQHLIVALDVSTAAAAQKIVAALGDSALTYKVGMVTPELFRKYPTVEDFAALTPEQLQPDVRSTGFFRNKSKSVVGAAKKIVSDFGGQVPDQMDELLTLPGVARKTANVVLGSCAVSAPRTRNGHRERTEVSTGRHRAPPRFFPGRRFPRNRRSRTRAR